MKKLMVLSGILIGFIFMQSCRHTPYYDPTHPSVSENCDPDTVYFQNEVLPMIISNCAKSGCHNGTGGEEEAKDLSDYGAIMNSDYVDPFNANGSELIEAVTTGGGEDKMPPSPNEPLTSDQIAILKTWINQGARNNECSGGCDTTNVTFAGTIEPLMVNYCNGCHGNTGNTTGINLTHYADTGSEDGVKTVAQDGRLWGSVNQDAGYSAMPKGGNRLQDCKIDELRIWLDAGFPNN